MFYNISACNKQQNNFCKNSFSLIKSGNKVISCLWNVEALEFSGKKIEKDSIFGALPWQRYDQNLKTDISFKNK